MNYKPTIANIEKFIKYRVFENMNRGYGYKEQFDIDCLIAYDIKNWKNTKDIYNVNRRDRWSVISILNKLLEAPCTQREIHEVKYLIQVLSTDWMFNREMHTYEEEAKNDNR